MKRSFMRSRTTPICDGRLGRIHGVSPSPKPEAHGRARKRTDGLRGTHERS